MFYTMGLTPAAHGEHVCVKGGMVRKRRANMQLTLRALTKRSSPVPAAALRFFPAAHCAAYWRLGIASRGLPWKPAALRFLLVVDAFHLDQMAGGQSRAAAGGQRTGGDNGNIMVPCFFF